MSRTLRLLIAATLGVAALVALAAADPASAGGSATPQTKYFEHCGTTTWFVPFDVHAITLTARRASSPSRSRTTRPT